MGLFFRKLFDQEQGPQNSKQIFKLIEEIWEENEENKGSEHEDRKILFKAIKHLMTATRDLAESMKPILSFLVDRSLMFVQKGIPLLEQSLRIQYPDNEIPNFPKFRDFQGLGNYLWFSIFEAKADILLVSPTLSKSFLPPSSGWSSISFQTTSFAEDPTLTVQLVTGWFYRTDIKTS